VSVDRGAVGLDKDAERVPVALADRVKKRRLRCWIPDRTPERTPPLERAEWWEMRVGDEFGATSQFYGVRDIANRIAEGEV
jgi:hypothetical protein